VSGPLAGKRILVTRPLKQGDTFVLGLMALGAEVIHLPAIQIERPSDFGPLDEALRGLASYDWLVVTSANGALAVLDRLNELGLDSRVLRSVRIAVVGPATARVFVEHGFEPEVLPREHVSTAIVAELGLLEGKRVLLARGDRAGKELPSELAKRGALVSDVVAYGIVEQSSVDFAGAPPDYITFTSGSAVEVTIKSLRQHAPDWLAASFACIGPITAAALEAVGLRPVLIAAPHTTEALAEAIVDHAQRGRCNYA
jgi:uroporphyrinogen III methyltransferase / synthase